MYAKSPVVSHWFTNQMTIQKLRDYRQFSLRFAESKVINILT